MRSITRVILPGVGAFAVSRLNSPGLLLVGTVAFALTLARTRMYTEDLAGLERGADAPTEPTWVGGGR